MNSFRRRAPLNTPLTRKALAEGAECGTAESLLDQATAGQEEMRRRFEENYDRQAALFEKRASLTRYVHAQFETAQQTLAAERQEERVRARYSSETRVNTTVAAAGRPEQCRFIWSKRSSTPSVDRDASRLAIRNVCVPAPSVRPWSS
jgi:hypothetical protein